MNEFHQFVPSPYFGSLFRFNLTLAFDYSNITSPKATKDSC